MSQTIDVTVPDIGDFQDVPVIEVLVKAGDRVNVNDSLATLESDKASMEIPSNAAGIVADVRIRVGDKVSKGTPIVTLTTDVGESRPLREAQRDDGKDEPVTLSVSKGQQSNAAQTVELTVPDIGDFHDIPVIDVLVKPGDTVEREATLITLESDKASMDVPASQAGVIEDVRLKVGDRVSKGAVIATLRADDAEARPLPFDRLRTSSQAQRDTGVDAPAAPSHVASAQSSAQPASSQGGKAVHASPAVRKLARELGLELGTVRGTGPHERITRDDLYAHVKNALARGTGVASGATSFAGLPAWPKVDFAQFGEIERKELPRIKRLSGPNLHRNWLSIPHITNYDEADITELEAFRVQTNGERKDGAKLTMLAFLVKASVAALQRFPEFNASLDGDALIYKRYYNIGFAADTPNGLVVPVLKGADRKGLLEIARDASELAAKARDGKLGMGDMSGGTFTISSIGGIGGTQFTQIVNAPEVAILGATRSTMKPVWDGSEFKPRLILPVSVSYDHRVIDGALAARFLAYLTSLLGDFRRVLL